MMNPSPLLSVIVITTSNERLQECLPRIIAATRTTVAEIILVCQGYQPDISRMDATATIMVLYTQELLGISRARNCGADYATGEFISFLDDDVYPDPEFFPLTLGFLQSSPLHMGVIGAIQVAESFNAPLFRKFRRPAMSVVGTFALWRLANGNSGVFRRTGMRFDPRLGVGAVFGSAEDADYLLALSRIGLIGFLPEAIIFHPDKDESELRQPARVRSYSRGIGACFAKNPGGPALAFLLASLINNFLSVISPRTYPTFRARITHLESVAAKLLAIVAWYRKAHSAPRVIGDKLSVSLKSISESVPRASGQ